MFCVGHTQPFVYNAISFGQFKPVLVALHVIAPLYYGKKGHLQCVSLAISVRLSERCLGPTGDKICILLTQDLTRRPSKLLERTGERLLIHEVIFVNSFTNFTRHLTAPLFTFSIFAEQFFLYTKAWILPLDSFCSQVIVSSFIALRLNGRRGRKI